MSDPVNNFFAGVIEGFYGQPWTQTERFELFDWMAKWGLNTYLYAPKDDLKHRALWREPYSECEQETLRALILRCHERKLRFIYGLSPGLDIRYVESSDFDHLRARFDQMRKLGCEHFALLFDDLPTAPQASIAAEQCRLANALLVKGHPILFCPTVYCGRMANDKQGYLATLGQELAPEINIFWTGPEIISPEITVPHIKALQKVLRRKPLIWDNLHANDYDGRRFYCGPYSGRPPELRNELSGILVNPNNEFLLNYVPLRTFAEFIKSDKTWDARQAYLSAIKEWLPHFETIHGPATFEDLVLFGDCYYLPHEEGPEAGALVHQRAFGKDAKRLRDFCARLPELRDRKLYYALFRRAWELREELDLLIRYSESPNRPYRPDSHLPGTFRGGMVARLQHLLKQQQDGAFTP